MTQKKLESKRQPKKGYYRPFPAQVKESIRKAQDFIRDYPKTKATEHG